MRELAPASRVFCGLWGLVPGGGVEPPRPEGRRILSPLRLPVPPSRLGGQVTALFYHCHLRHVARSMSLAPVLVLRCGCPIAAVVGLQLVLMFLDIRRGVLKITSMSMMRTRRQDAKRLAFGHSRRHRLS